MLAARCSSNLHDIAVSVFIGIGPGYFPFLVVASVMLGAENVLLWTSATQLSGVWFPPNERTLATAIFGSSGAQV